MRLKFVDQFPLFKIGLPQNHASEPQAHPPIAEAVRKPSSRHIFSRIKSFGSSLNEAVPRLWEPKRDSVLPVIGTLVQNGDNLVAETVRPFPRFRPYVAKHPWHGGVRAFLSQLFPRYGHYCGPNWSSGKDRGSKIWDRRPIDWLDLCCYCHDMGYDTHDQVNLLKADLAFLHCLENPRENMRGDAHVAQLYRMMCITGLRNFLIPYRMQLIRLQEQQFLVDWFNILQQKMLFKKKQVQ